jgi:hypothetical protein
MQKKLANLRDAGLTRKRAMPIIQDCILMMEG